MHERLIEANLLWKPEFVEKKKNQTHQVQISEFIWFDPEIYWPDGVNSTCQRSGMRNPG